MEEPKDTQSAEIVKYTLDGREISLVELNEAKNKPGTKLVETSPGCFKTLQRLNG